MYHHTIIPMLPIKTSLFFSIKNIEDGPLNKDCLLDKLTEFTLANMTNLLDENSSNAVGVNTRSKSVGENIVLNLSKTIEYNLLTRPLKWLLKIRFVSVN